MNEKWFSKKFGRHFVPAGLSGRGWGGGRFIWSSPHFHGFVHPGFIFHSICGDNDRVVAATIWRVFVFQLKKRRDPEAERNSGQDEEQQVEISLHCTLVAVNRINSDESLDLKLALKFNSSTHLHLDEHFRLPIDPPGSRCLNCAPLSQQ